MPGIATPPVMIEPFAVSAAGPQITNPIPKTTSTPGAASYDLGFPPDTMQPIVSGGVPPFGPDFNGILFAITASIAAMQAGQPWLYNTDIVTAIGGYPAGTVLGSTDSTGLWMSVVNSNVTDPDGGAPSGWVPLYFYGQGVVAGLTNANVVLTATQYKRQFLVFSGALTANVQITLPTVFQSWLAINNCTGAFTLKLLTAAGTGVVIPAGGPTQPTPIYCDGTNIQQAVAPLSVPISVPVVPSTLVERDNLGNIFAQRLSQAQPAETLTTGFVAVMNNAGGTGDTFMRWQSLAAFAAQLATTLIKNGVTTTTAGGANRFNYPVAFPNTGNAPVICPTANSAAFALIAWDRFGFNYNTGAAVPFSYIATGT